MRSALIAVVLVAGCAGKDSYDRALDALAGFRDQMCACADAACADKVSQARLAYLGTLPKQLDASTQPTKQQLTAGRAIEDATRTCRKQLTGAGEEPVAPHYRQ